MHHPIDRIVYTTEETSCGAQGGNWNSLMGPLRGIHPLHLEWMIYVWATPHSMIQQNLGIKCPPHNHRKTRRCSSMHYEGIWTKTGKRKKLSLVDMAFHLHNAVWMIFYNLHQVCTHTHTHTHTHIYIT